MGEYANKRWESLKFLSIFFEEIIPFIAKIFNIFNEIRNLASNFIVKFVKFPTLL